MDSKNVSRKGNPVQAGLRDELPQFDEVYFAPDEPNDEADSLGTDSRVDTAIESIFLENESSDHLLGTFSSALQDQSRRELHSLFQEILLQYLPTIRDHIQEIFRGNDSIDLIVSFQGTLRPLLEAGASLEYEELYNIFQEFMVNLRNLKKNRELARFSVIRPFHASFDKLLRALDQDIRDQFFRELRYVKRSNPLLETIRRIRYIGPVRIQRLYSSGLSNTENIEMARVDEIRYVTGIPEALCEEIKEVASSFKASEQNRQMKEILAYVRTIEDYLPRLPVENTPNLVEMVLPALTELGSRLRESVREDENEKR